MSLAARDSEFRRWSGRVDRRICQTFAASPAEPGELPLGFSPCLPESCPDVSATFTTIAFDNSSLRWLEINT
jgi:hypothetical protein